MTEGYVTEKVCDLKHKEVDEMKDEILKLRDCIQNKFGKMYIILFGVLTALVTNLIIMLVR